jgi:hypothetical protein
VQPLKNFPTFYGTRRFNTVFTRALHWSLSRAISIQSTPSRPIYLRFILILSTHLRLCVPSGLFPSGFPTNILYAFRFSIRATCPAHLILLDLITPYHKNIKYSVTAVWTPVLFQIYVLRSSMNVNIKYLDWFYFIMSSSALKYSAH